MARIEFPKNKHGKVISPLKIGIIYLIKLKNLAKIVLFFIFLTNLTLKNEIYAFFFEKSKNGCFLQHQK